MLNTLEMDITTTHPQWEEFAPLRFVLLMAGVLQMRALPLDAVQMFVA